MRISREDFHLMRVGEFWEALAAFREEKDDDRRHIGELVRGAALRLLNIQLRVQDRISDPRLFWPMPWDEKTDSADEAARLEALTGNELGDEIQKAMERLKITE